LFSAGRHPTESAYPRWAEGARQDHQPGCDAHLKNFGVLYDKPGLNVRLAPVYDMLSTVPYQPNDVLALQLGGSKQFPRRQQLIQYGRQSCGLSSKAQEQIMAQSVCGWVGYLDRVRQEKDPYARISIHKSMEVIADEPLPADCPSPESEANSC
jgi:hypothetical protein